MQTIEGQLLAALAQACPCATANRINHARGMLLTGHFVAAPEAAQLTVAAHMQGTAVPLLVRFSNFTGDPDIADNDPRANPRGIALRFSPANGPSTDLVGHAVDGFPAGSPQEFLHFLQAAEGAASAPDMFERYLDHHVAARRFLQMIPQTPQCYAAEQYFTLHTLALRAADGRCTVGRVRIVPADARPRLDADEAAKRAPDFLQQGLRQRVETAPVRMQLVLQVAAAGDALDDISTPWPEDRRQVLLGDLTLDRIVADKAQQSLLVFDPGNLVPGLESTNDAMLAVRSAAYRLAYERRRPGAELDNAHWA